MYTTFQQTFVYILFTKLKELWQLIFYIKRLPKVSRNVGYILYTVCIHFAYINSDLQNLCIIKIMYSVCIHSSYRMYVQIIVC